MSFDKQWVAFRDSFEALFMKGFNYLKPVVIAAGNAALPLIEQAGVTAAVAIQQAAANGTAHGGHDMIDVGLKSVRDQVPTLEASVGTAVVAAAVQKAKEMAAQAANDVAPPATDSPK